MSLVLIPVTLVTEGPQSSSRDDRELLLASLREVVLFDNVGTARSDCIGVVGGPSCLMPIASAAGEVDRLIAISRQAAAITDGLCSRQA